MIACMNAIHAARKFLEAEHAIRMSTRPKVDPIRFPGLLSVLLSRFCPVTSSAAASLRCLSLTLGSAALHLTLLGSLGLDSTRFGSSLTPLVKLVHPSRRGLKVV